MLDNVQTSRLLEEKTRTFKQEVTNEIEKRFRDSRKVIIPLEQRESMEVPLRRTKRGNIDNVRLILKNWNVPAKELVTPELSYKAIIKYKTKIRNYYVGKTERCPKCFHLLLEEYREYIELAENQRNSDELIKLEAFKYLVFNWDDAKGIATVFEIPEDKIEKWKHLIKGYLNNKNVYLSKEKKEAIDSNKDELLEKIINERETKRKVKRKYTHDNFEVILKNWNDLLCEENLKVYSKSSLLTYKTAIIKYLETGKTTSCISRNKAKLIDKYRNKLINKKSINNYNKSSVEQNKAKEEIIPKFYASEAVQKIVSKNPELIEKRDTSTNTIQNTENGECIVKFIDYLKKQGIKEITLKF